MSESILPGTSGLVMNEPLLWEKGDQGRIGFSMPERDVPRTDPPQGARDEAPDLPELSEVDVVRHYTRLSQWNFGVDSGTYPLGSCTMKYNPKINEDMAALPGFSACHPMLPETMNQGALKLMHRMQEMLGEITGLRSVSLQPAAGAHGEYSGMRIIHAYIQKHSGTRKKMLIPDTAHGTNPASAAMCGYQAVPVQSNEQGILTAEKVRELMDEDTAGIMVTNPNTLGLFEENLGDIAEIIHAKGGLVYCDGANMNALMGIVDFANLGVDVLHLNLHKTFSAPHGGGGPGSGPICVHPDLDPYLPVPRVEKHANGYRLSQDYPDSIGRLHSFYGNFGVMVKSYAYILTLGPLLKRVSQMAVLNANYLRQRIKGAINLPYDRLCMHECVFTDRYQEQYKVNTANIAKRLLDYGFHPPTIYFPLVVNGAMMLEPTENEAQQDLDMLVEAYTRIAREAEEDPDLLRNAPHITKVTKLDETAAARNLQLTG